MTACGTNYYAAPEQSSRSYDFRADLFPLGIILLELYWPVESRSEGADELTRLRRQRLVPERLSSLYPRIADYIYRLTQVQPDQRPSLQELMHTDWGKQ